MSTVLTKRYSTSFSSASSLFPAQMQPHIYAIYGLVRIADEIVDTYSGSDATDLLNQLEQETANAIRRRFSTNPIVHAFAITATDFNIDDSLIRPFFASMRTDLTKWQYTQKQYASYIHGSAEVVGLMCLKVFCQHDTNAYEDLKTGASHLGAAYQKINFLRDLADDYHRLKRCYFPGVSFNSIDETVKESIIQDIRDDLSVALPALRKLPKNVQPAVMTSYQYYEALLSKLSATPIDVIKRRRIRLSGLKKVSLLSSVILRGSR